MTLTKKRVDAAKYDGDGKSWSILYDQEVPGFGVRIYPSGAKSFVVRYRTRHGRTRLATVGKVGVLTLDQARVRAKKMLVEVTDGKDPIEERKREKAVTLAKFAPIYLERHAKPRKKTWKEDERRINNDILPALGSRALADIRRADVNALHAKVGKRAPYEANRVLALIATILARAERWGYLPEGSPNPAKGIEPFKEKSRDRYVTPNELPRLVAAIEQEENPFIRGALWLLILTGCRKSEILRAKWEDVDFGRRELRIEEDKAGRVRVVPLTDPAMQVLEELPKVSNNPHIFPGAGRGQPLKHISKNWKAIRERAKLEGVRLHDVRRTTGSWLAMSGASLPLIGKVLGHSNPSTTAIYARLSEDAARGALEGYNAQVLRVVKGGKS